MSYSKIHVQTPPAPRQTHFQSVKAFHEEIQIPLRRSLPGNTCCNKPQLCSIPNVALSGLDILNRQAIRETLTKEIMELSGIVQNGSDAPPIGEGDVCFFLTMRCFNDAMFSNS